MVYINLEMKYDIDIINNIILMNRLENRFKNYLEKT